MNDASSRFVDRLATEKLINEKLSKVRHSSDNSLFVSETVSFDDMDKFVLEKSQIEVVDNSNGVSHYIIPSFCRKHFYLENNYIHIWERKES